MKTQRSASEYVFAAAKPPSGNKHTVSPSMCTVWSAARSSAHFRARSHRRCLAGSVADMRLSRCKIVAMRRGGEQTLPRIDEGYKCRREPRLHCVSRKICRITSSQMWTVKHFASASRPSHRAILCLLLAKSALLLAVLAASRDG